MRSVETSSTTKESLVFCELPPKPFMRRSSLSKKAVVVEAAVAAVEAGTDSDSDAGDASGSLGETSPMRAERVRKASARARLRKASAVVCVAGKSAAEVAALEAAIIGDREPAHVEPDDPDRTAAEVARLREARLADEKRKADLAVARARRDLRRLDEVREVTRGIDLFEPRVNVVAIACGSMHSAALSSLGHLYLCRCRRRRQYEPEDGRCGGRFSVTTSGDLRVEMSMPVSKESSPNHANLSEIGGFKDKFLTPAKVRVGQREHGPARPGRHERPGQAVPRQARVGRCVGPPRRLRVAVHGRGL
jgi:hypothetical protein